MSKRIVGCACSHLAGLVIAAFLHPPVLPLWEDKQAGVFVIKSRLFLAAQHEILIEKNDQFPLTYRNRLFLWTVSTSSTSRQFGA